jgi:protein TonB
MKKYITIALICFSFYSFSQNSTAIDSIKPPKSVSAFVVEKVPVFAGCEKAQHQKKCFESKVRRFIGKHFDTQRAKCLKFETIFDDRLKKDVEICEKELKSTRVRINTFFVIDTLGVATQIKANSDYPTLNKEAERVLKKLPKFEPGIQRGKKVRVRFMIPIMFHLF